MIGWQEGSKPITLVWVRFKKSVNPLVYSIGTYGPEPNQDMAQSRHSFVE